MLIDRTRTGAAGRSRGLFLALLLGMGGWLITPALAQAPAEAPQDAAASLSQSGAEAPGSFTGGHRPGEGPGEAQGGAHEEESELAVEHGSWFKPITDAINRGFGGKKVVSGYIFTSWVVIALLSLLSFFGTKSIREGRPEATEPTGLQNFLEFVVEGLTGFIEGIIGPGGGKYVPLVATFFLYILLCNYIALIPGFVAPTSTLNQTVALGLTAFVAVQYFAIRKNGLGKYLHHFAGSPKDALGWGMAILMFPLEVIGELVKPLSLSMRLFGNIFGEDTVVLQLALLSLSIGGWKILHGHVVEPGAAWAGLLPLHLPMMLFSLFGGLIQALVFTMLVCVYISLLTSHEHEGHDHEHDSEAAHH